MKPTVVLYTDFGSRDGYVGAMKGAMLSYEPALQFVDVMHDLEPGDVAAAAWALRQAAPHFPPACVHLVVVDPGVGTLRRAVACEADGRRYVAPDNGVLHWALAGTVRAHAIAVSEDASPVFHGRDVFGPAAAALAAGTALETLGPRVEPASLTRLGFAVPETGGSTWRGTVVHVDRFGNAITDLPLPAGTEGTASAGRHELPLARTYADVSPGEALAVRGSSGTLELSVRDSSAAAVLGVCVGDVITFRVA